MIRSRLTRRGRARWRRTGSWSPVPSVNETGSCGQRSPGTCPLSWNDECQWLRFEPVYRKADQPATSSSLRRSDLPFSASPLRPIAAAHRSWARSSVDGTARYWEMERRLNKTIVQSATRNSTAVRVLGSRRSTLTEMPGRSTATAACSGSTRQLFCPLALRRTTGRAAGCRGRRFAGVLSIPGSSLQRRADGRYLWPLIGIEEAHSPVTACPEAHNTLPSNHVPAPAWSRRRQDQKRQATIGTRTGEWTVKATATS
jgi:hypothetical protein